MAQFDVFRLEDGELVLDLQTDLLGHFESRIVVPLMPPGRAPIAHRRLNPILVVEGAPYAMVTQFAAAVDRRTLSRPITNLPKDYDAIRAALDMIFLGF